ncbi:aminoacyl-tRNA hydrolase [Chitinophaga sp. GCM10012297]|uniref:Peptidyl-tRNA hydrolase n=1 Tax=Chitinophaga chungangae TaxID=2821488 RepID=A0ABS3Y7V0_9BACT|nr:aminoacyl-tRNA hydrolase [Chitinophaga chungangae]MBO9150752.1 aminoacyl-tRNA hydrolase [Chitinophaga chungangae]
MKYLIVGLGNIGTDYHHTRHNIGFDVADAFAAKHGALFRSDRLADVAEVKWKGRIFVVIKPTTYMNLSGKAVKYWMDKEKVPLENILVILDELALPLDVIRLRPGGSDAGHNGLKSIQESIGTNQYPRLRFGIGNDFPKGRQVDYVLGKWSAKEEPVVQQKIDKCTEAIESFGSIGLQRSMNNYNNLTFPL